MVKKSGEVVRLQAESKEDLAVLSAMIQDATIRVGDIAWLQSRRRFATVINRYCWENDAPKAGKKPHRVRAGLRFENVLEVRFRNVPVDDDDHILGLLSISASLEEDGTGALDLDFSGFAAIRLEVECIEAYLEDMTRPWRAIARPSHDGDEEVGVRANTDQGADEAFEEN